MRRRAQAAKAKVEAKRPLARKSRGTDGSSRRELEKRLAEALEQQAATSEILGVIRRSPMDAQPVFDVIIRNAVRLCDGLFGCLFRFDGERLRLVAHHNFTAEAVSLYERTYPVQATRDQLLGPIVLEQRVMNVADVLQAVRNLSGRSSSGFGVDSACRCSAPAPSSVPLPYPGRPWGCFRTHRWSCSRPSPTRP